MKIAAVTIGLALLGLSCQLAYGQSQALKLPPKLPAKTGPVKQMSMSRPNNKPLSAQLRRATMFKEWADNKVPSGKTKKTFISILNEPRPQDVERVVFISAGQQQPDPRNLSQTAMGYPNVLTGQYRHYRSLCQGQPECKTKIKPGSLAYRIYKSSRYPLKSTLMVLVFDAQFNHGVKEGNKIKIENAFWDLLTKRFYSGKVKQLALIGQSKGGCLSFSLAKRFRHTDAYKNIPIILQGYDPVCKMKRLVHKGTKTYYSNPLKKNQKYKSMRIDMNAVFPNHKRNNLAILNIHSGAAVVTLGKNIGGVHSFTYKPHNVDLGWWKQTWVVHEHTDMGGNMKLAKDTVIPGFKHLNKYSQKFASYQPPGGGVIGNQVANCPKLFPKKVGSKSAKPICVAAMPAKIKTSKCTSRNSPGQIWASKYCIWQKGKYWHARPLKAKDKSQKCPAQYSRKVDSYNGKPVCMAVASRKIKARKCGGDGGIQRNNFCLWNKGAYYKARKLK